MRKVILAAALVGGCATTPQGSVEVSKTIDVEYSKFGACAYRALLEYGTTPKMADLRGDESIIISLTNPTAFTGELTEVEFNIKKTAAQQTRVDIRTRFGMQRYSERHWQIIEKCSKA